MRLYTILLHLFVAVSAYAGERDCPTAGTRFDSGGAGRVEHAMIIERLVAPYYQEALIKGKIALQMDFPDDVPAQEIHDIALDSSFIYPLQYDSMQDHRILSEWFNFNEHSFGIPFLAGRIQGLALQNPISKSVRVKLFMEVDNLEEKLPNITEQFEFIREHIEGFLVADGGEVTLSTLRAEDVGQSFDALVMTMDVRPQIFLGHDLTTIHYLGLAVANELKPPQTLISILNPDLP